MSWLEKILPKSKITAPRRHNIPEGVWTKCSACEQVLYRAELERNLEVCPKCDHHMRISARARLESFLDEQGRTEIGAELEPQDVLKFKDSKRYKDRLSAAQKETAEKDALVVMKGTLKGYRLSPVRSNSPSWVAPWPPWSVPASCAPSRSASRKAVVWSASPPLVVLACRKPSSP